ncbi:MAG: KH domain-containing protein [Terriglobales bacterium]|jgi:predicted RNA-binding protein YlqC (UPF0109 family)
MPENESGDMRKLVEEIAKALVDSPDAVSVKADESDQGAAIELHVAAADMGRVIGKQGRTARSMRNILGVAGMKLQKRFTLDIVD